ncbi:hypothetical protein ScPMuIL_010020 [Solemya velum]
MMMFKCCLSGLLLIYAGCNIVQGAKEQTIEVHDAGLGTKCDEKTGAFSTCMTCAGLPDQIAIPVEKCCTEYLSFSVCEECINDVDTCMKAALDVDSLFSDFDYDNMDLLDYKPLDESSSNPYFGLKSTDLYDALTGPLSDYLLEKRSHNYNMLRQSRSRNARGQLYAGRYFSSPRNNKRNGPSRIFRKIYTGK